MHGVGWLPGRPDRAIPTLFRCVHLFSTPRHCHPQLHGQHDLNVQRGDGLDELARPYEGIEVEELQHRWAGALPVHPWLKHYIMHTGF